MAIYFSTTLPSGLLTKFDATISQTEPLGKITTWVKNNDGYYTHKSAEWGSKAWLKPGIVENTTLVFNIIKPNNSNVGQTVYGHYHGHLIETFLNHFDQLFTQGIATALAATGDVP